LNSPLPWHADNWVRLQRARAADRLPHALLLRGRSGLGKGAFARRLAQTLLCTQGGNEPCGECKSCRQFAAGTSPDFFPVEPLEDKKTIGVDQIRELIETLTLTSHGGGRRIAVIEPADAMNANAANSLLKTLEEPPGSTVLILVTARPARLPATVRSRCRQISFVAPSSQMAVDWLVAKGVEKPAAARLLAMAGGRPLKALAMNEAEDTDRFEAIPAAARDIVLGKRNPVTVAASLSNAPLDETLEVLIGWVASLARASLAGVNESDPAGERLGPRKLFAALDRLYEAEKLRDTSINSQLLLESLLAPLAPTQGKR
jgi:DNA polymerase-3 subunit delta'